MGSDLRTNFAENYRKRHRLAPTIVLAVSIAVLLGAVVFFAYKLSSAPVRDIVPAAMQGLVDPDRAAIQAWLAENLDNPDYEVVRWYPAVDNPRGPGRAIRLKFRSKNVFGAKVLRDEMFYLDGNGTITEVRTMGRGA